MTNVCVLALYKKVLQELHINSYRIEVLFFVDIDECATGSHQCNQNCGNTNGSYLCYCNSGYELHNATTCVGRCNTMYMYIYLLCIHTYFRHK